MNIKENNQLCDFCKQEGSCIFEKYKEEYAMAVEAGKMTMDQANEEYLHLKSFAIKKGCKRLLK